MKTKLILFAVLFAMLIAYNGPFQDYVSQWDNHTIPNYLWLCVAVICYIIIIMLSSATGATKHQIKFGHG